MLKRLIDAIRGQEGYAGMAIFLDSNMVFCEMLELELSDRIKGIFMEGKAIFHAKSMMAVIQGYTINAFMAGDTLVICRLEGRFSVAIQPTDEEPSYTSGHQEHRLKREEARKEAEGILKLLLKSQ